MRVSRWGKPVSAVLVRRDSGPATVCSSFAGAASPEERLPCERADDRRPEGCQEKTRMERGRRRDTLYPCCRARELLRPPGALIGCLVRLWSLPSSVRVSRVTDEAEVSPVPAGGPRPMHAGAKLGSRFRPNNMKP